jgi:hypothetical protein
MTISHKCSAVQFRFFFLELNGCHSQIFTVKFSIDFRVNLRIFKSNFLGVKGREGDSPWEMFLDFSRQC